MISYKKINLLDLTLDDEKNIKNKGVVLEIKSPIIAYTIKDSSLNLSINGDSDVHNLFHNLCGYIDRLFKIRDINANVIKDKTITLNIDENSRFYDENTKALRKSNVKIEGKVVCSFTCKEGKFTLRQFLSVK